MLQNVLDVFAAHFIVALEFCYWIEKQSITEVPLVLGLQPRDEAAMLGVNTIKSFSKNLHENGF